MQKEDISVLIIYTIFILLIGSAFGAYYSDNDWKDKIITTTLNNGTKLSFNYDDEQKYFEVREVNLSDFKFNFMTNTSNE